MSGLRKRRSRDGKREQDGEKDGVRGFVIKGKWCPVTDEEIKCGEKRGKERKVRTEKRDDRSRKREKEKQSIERGNPTTDRRGAEIDEKERN